MKSIALLLSLTALSTLSACGPGAPPRDAKMQKEIDQCIAGMAGLYPDLKQRTIICECTGEAMYSNPPGDADKCVMKAGLDADDPFGIKGNDDPAASTGAPTEYKDDAEGYDDSGYASGE